MKTHRILTDGPQSERVVTVFGMAKSYLDVRGAKARNLRLDAELLARRLSEFRSRGKRAVGYLLVLSERVAKRARSWDIVASNPDLIVVLATLSESDRNALLDEKRRNAEGLSSGKPADSRADLGCRIAEEALWGEIRQRHLHVQQIPCNDREEVNWDFFGEAYEV